jgi:uncharacterized protein (TIGR03435 family)
MPKQLAIWMATASFAWAQSPAFEVASVHPSQDGAKNMAIRRDPAGGITFANANLKNLVLMAYNIQDYQLAGASGWMQSDRYDVIARAPADAKKSDTWLMLQSLLAERFQLVVRRETKEQPIFEMVVAKNGPKFREPTRPPGEADGSFRTANGHIKCLRAGMDTLAFALAEVVGRRVVDKTGISGKFDLTLDWAPEGPTIFTALTEQLGLRLEGSKGRVETVTIEWAERPSVN